MPDRSDTIREVSDYLGPQIAVLQMPGTGRDTWTAPDGGTFVRIDRDGTIVVGKVVEAGGERVGYSIGDVTAETALLVAAAIAEKAAIVIAERRP